MILVLLAFSLLLPCKAFITMHQRMDLMKRLDQLTKELESVKKQLKRGAGQFFPFMDRMDNFYNTLRSFFRPDDMLNLKKGNFPCFFILRSKTKMPIHEFSCKSCSYNFELLLMNKRETEDVRCPKCQSPEVSKLLSAPNISTDTMEMKKTSTRAHQPVHHQCGSNTCSTFNLPGHKK